MKLWTEDPVIQGTRHQKRGLSSDHRPVGSVPWRLRRADPTGRNPTSHWGALLCRKSAPWRKRCHKNWFSDLLHFFSSFDLASMSLYHHYTFLLFPLLISFCHSPRLFFFPFCFPFLPLSLLYFIICPMFSLHLTPFHFYVLSCFHSLSKHCCLRSRVDMFYAGKRVVIAMLHQTIWFCPPSQSVRHICISHSILQPPYDIFQKELFFYFISSKLRDVAALWGWIKLTLAVLAISGVQGQVWRSNQSR